jgi:predicted flap endonuclease-1-like 5' DNA nuclease
VVNGAPATIELGCRLCHQWRRRYRWRAETPAQGACKSAKNLARGQGTSPRAKAEKAAKNNRYARRGCGPLDQMKRLMARRRSPKCVKKARAGGADDLKQIKGIGKVLEDKLHGLGSFTFDQIAAGPG